MFTCTHAFLISPVLSFVLFFLKHLCSALFPRCYFHLHPPHWIVSIMQVGSAWVPNFVACSHFENSYSLFSLLMVVLECLPWLSRVWEARETLHPDNVSEIGLWWAPLFFTRVHCIYIPSDIWFHPFFDCMALHFFPSCLKHTRRYQNTYRNSQNHTYPNCKRPHICYNMKNSNRIYIQQ